MVDTVKTIGTGGDYADPILWAAAEGNVNDGTRAVGIIQNDITMSALFRPNQSFPNGGLLKGKDTQTGVSGAGQKLGNTAGTRICLSPSDNLDFQDIEFNIGANTYVIQNTGSNTLTNCIMINGYIYYTAEKTLTLNNSLIDKIDGLASTTQGNVIFNNTTITDRLIIRAETLLTIKNSNSLGTDWLLGRGTYTNSETLANFNYILQNAPASDFGVGSSDNTLNTDTALEMVDFASGDYRIKATSTLATAGQGGSFIGAFLEAASISSTTSGTSIPTQTETSIVSGGKTIVLTLTGDTFVTGTVSEDAIALGSNSDITASGTNWNSVIKSALTNANVVISTTTVANDTATITLPAFVSYDTAVTETIEWTIPASSLVTSATDIVSVPTFTVTAVSGTILAPYYYINLLAS